MIRPAFNRGMISLTNTNVRAEAISSEKSAILSIVANCELMNLDSNEHIAVIEKSSSGRIVIIDPVFSSFTSIFFLMI